MRTVFAMLLLSCFTLLAQGHVVEMETLQLRNDEVQKLVGDDGRSVDALSGYFFANDMDAVLNNLRKKQKEAEFERNVVYIGQNKFRFDAVEEGRKMSHIVDNDSKKIYSIDWKDKSYFEMDLEKLRQMRDQVKQAMGQQMAQMQQMMENLPPEAKAKMKEMGMMGGDESAKVTVKSTGKKKTVNNFECSEYVVHVGENNRRQYWITRSRDHIRKAFEALIDVNPMESQTEMKIWQEIEDGWPAASVEIDAANYSVSVIMVRIASVAKATHPSGTFNAPKDFKKKSMPDMMPGAMPMPNKQY